MQKKNLFLFFSLLFLLFGSNTTFAQKNDHTKDSLKPWQIDTLIRPVPINRQLFTDRVNKAIKKLDVRDGIVDNKIAMDDTFRAGILNNIFFKQLPLLDVYIENSNASHQTKIAYHRALESMVNRFYSKNVYKEDILYFKNATENFKNMFIALEEGTIKTFAKNNANIYTIDNDELLHDYPAEKAYVYESVGTAQPSILIKRLKEFGNEKYADPIVAAAAKTEPGILLSYATSTSFLSNVVRRNNDPLVKTIVNIADNSKDPLKVLPLIGSIYAGKMTIAEADAAAKNEKNYYKALVAEALLHNNLGKDDLEKELNYRGLQLVRVVNSLHDEPAARRFASIMDFNAYELYYMILGSQNEIYTSSFTFMAKRLLEKMQPETGDEFLKKLNYNRFRTWIRMSAGYNTLSPFLATMNEENKNNLLSEFVSGLEKGGDDDLTDAVDVADAFGSITDTALLQYLEQEVVKNYKRTVKSKKGTIVYGLLLTIMKSARNPDELAGKLSIIPPITYVPYKELQSKGGGVVIQTFFFGDADGRMSFGSFQNNFPAASWTKTSNQQWVKYSYKGEYKVDVYANIPGDEEKNEDIAAQEALQKYFDENAIQPSIVIHRGHSYHLGGSLENLNPNVKVVMLGSCGGYHDLSRILDKSPDANIISSKQTGAMLINEPIIKEMLKSLTTGQNLDWIKSWKDLSDYFSKRTATERDLFSDYIPPNENLGAIFIKAYRRMLLQVDKL